MAEFRESIQLFSGCAIWSVTVELLKLLNRRIDFVMSLLEQCIETATMAENNPAHGLRMFDL